MILEILLESTFAELRSTYSTAGITSRAPMECDTMTISLTQSGVANFCRNRRKLRPSQYMLVSSTA